MSRVPSASSKNYYQCPAIYPVFFFIFFGLNFANCIGILQEFQQEFRFEKQLANITFSLELSDDEARYLTDLSNYLEGRQEKSK